MPRAKKRDGAPAPTRAGKPHGKSFTSDYNPRRASEKNDDHAGSEEAEPSRLPNM